MNESMIKNQKQLQAKLKEQTDAASSAAEASKSQIQASGGVMVSSWRVSRSEGLSVPLAYVLRSSSNMDPLHVKKGSTWPLFSSAVLLVHVLSWGGCLTRTAIVETYTFNELCS